LYTEKSCFVNHQVNWLDDAHTLIQQRYTGVLRLEEYLPTLEHCATLIRMEDHAVDIVLDVRGLSITQMREFFAVVRYVTSKVPSNQRRVVVCADRLFINALCDATSSVALKTMATMQFFETLEAAIDYLCSERTEVSCPA
jgi:hypothetical protein